MLKLRIAALGLVLLGLYFLATTVNAQVISIDSKLSSAKDRELADQVRLKSWGYAKLLLERLGADVGSVWIWNLLVTGNRT